MELKRHTSLGRRNQEDSKNDPLSTSQLTGLLLILVLTGLSGCNGCNNNQPRPLDIVPTGYDANGFLLNPRWQAQASKGPTSLVDYPGCIPNGGDQDDPKNWFSGANPCTHFHVTTERGKGCGPHVNWFPVTIEGKIFWEGHSVDEFGEDDDYSFNIASKDNALGWMNRTLDGKGQTGLLHSEFDSDEAIDPLLDHVFVGWWTQFKAAVDQENKDAWPFINGKNVIAVGLLNLDCAGHIGGGGCSVELHPIYVLAISLQPDPDHPDPRHDRWALLAMNRGDQGYCTGSEQSLNQLSNSNEAIYQYRVILPQPNFAAGSAPVFKNKTVAMRAKDNWGPAGTNFDSQYLGSKGIQLTFKLPNPATQGDGDHWVIMGDIELDWGLVIPPPPPGPKH